MEMIFARVVVVVLEQHQRTTTHTSAKPLAMIQAAFNDAALNGGEQLRQPQQQTLYAVCSGLSTKMLMLHKLLQLVR